MTTTFPEKTKKPLTAWRVASIIGALFGILSIIGLVRGYFNLGLVSVFRGIHDFYETSLQNLLGWWLEPILSEIVRGWGLSLNPSWKHLLVLAIICLSVTVRTGMAAFVYFRARRGAIAKSFFDLMAALGSMIFAAVYFSAGLVLSTMVLSPPSAERLPMPLTATFSLVVVTASLASGTIYGLYALLRTGDKESVSAVVAAPASALPTILGAALFVLANAGLAYLGAD